MLREWSKQADFDGHRLAFPSQEPDRSHHRTFRSKLRQLVGVSLLPVLAKIKC
jgi:hypothetical protein